MKQQQKRVVSALLVLVMVLSLFSGLTVHVHAASYVYNWGTRGTTATELSDAAVAFYEKNQVTYEDLAAYTGSSSVSSVPSSTLYDELAELMESNHKTITSYDGTRELYRYTDCQNGGGKISSFYSGASIGPDWDSGKTWNREHVWPNSKGEGSAENDIMMLRPTASSENFSRGNKAYGESGGYYYPNSESNGQYDLRGDVSRIVLYVYTRWGNTTKMWGTEGVIESKDVLLKWIEEDPVDTWELGRNDAVQSITGTRNVFVDYPELAFVLFGTEVPDDMATPSGKAQNSVSYTITATANNANMGTVSVSGSKITATPTQGFAVSGYEVTSGTATVTQNGNTFNVKATSDCTIQINFEAAQQVSIAYMGNGVQVSSETAYTGDVMELPGYQGTVPGGYTFLGWTDTTVSHSDEKPEYYEAGDDYTVSGNATLHALFSYVVEGSGTAGAWTLVTDASQLAVGANVVVASAESFEIEDVEYDLALSTTQNNNNRAQTTITRSEDKKTVTPSDDVAVLTLGEGTMTDTWSFYCSNGDSNSAGYLYAASSGSNWLRTYQELDDNGSFKIEVDESGIATIKAQGTNTRNWIRYNDYNKIFSCYGSTNQQNDVSIYIQASGSTKYTTSSCSHANTKDVDGLAATCTTAGYTAGVMCTDCNAYIEGHEIVAMLGHTYDIKVVTDPTTTEKGYTTYTCSVCGDTKEDDDTFIISFSVPEGVTAIASVTCDKNGITLPNADVPAEGYTFLGWTKAAVDNTETRPSFNDGGKKYYPDDSVTLFALYSYHVGGNDVVGDYTLVTDVTQLKAGYHVVIAATNENVALSTNQKNNNRGEAPIFKSDDKKTITFNENESDEAVAELILEQDATAGTWSFRCDVNKGYLYAASSSKNYLRTQTTLNANGSFTIEVSETGVATIKAQGNNTHNWLRYNSNENNGHLFSCYITGQDDVSLYIQTADGTTYYTTEMATECAHTGGTATCKDQAICDLCHKPYGKVDPTNHTEITIPGKDATCTDTGLTEGKKCSVCGTTTVEQKEIPVNSHTEVTIPGKDATCTDTGLTEGKKCSVCGTTTVEQKEIPTKSHTEVTIPGKDATCTDTGLTEGKKCSTCGTVTKAQETIPVLNHQWDAGEVTKEPTETETGVRTYTCGTCGDKKTEDIPVLGHTHKYETKVTAPTCTEKGYTTYTCSCGDSYKDNYVDAAGHKWDNGKVTKEPTETETGVRTYTCGTCGDKKTEDIPVLGHTHKYETKVTAPTCTERGYTAYTCSCGDSYKDNYVDASGHKWDNGKVTKEPTETETGVHTYTCGTCGETKTESIPVLGHTHKHEAVVTAPTCTERGYTTYTCSCGDSYKDNYVDAAGHKITYVVQTEPTTEADGVLAGSCENCDHKTKIVLPKLNKESYTYEVIQQPTADEPGVGRYVWTTEYGTFSFDVALEQLQTVVLGDTDGNGKIQTNDAKLVLQYVVKMPATLNLDAADVDGNGKIQTNDAKLILQYVVKIITQFPAQNA